MRLFTALWPSAAAIEDLSAAVTALDGDQVTAATAGLRAFRFIPSTRWHLTLCFHGDHADQHHLAERLTSGVAEARSALAHPPRLRLSGGGVFRGVLWAGVQLAGADDARALHALVRAAGGDPCVHRPHLTVARWSAGRADRALLVGLLEGYVGPWWTAEELDLVRSVQQQAGPEYRTVHRVPVNRRDSG